MSEYMFADVTVAGNRSKGFHRRGGAGQAEGERYDLQFGRMHFSKLKLVLKDACSEQLRMHVALGPWPERLYRLAIPGVNFDHEYLKVLGNLEQKTGYQDDRNTYLGVGKDVRLLARNRLAPPRASKSNSPRNGEKDGRE